MYGFIEKRMADILVSCGVITSYEPYSNADGQTAAIIDRDAYVFTQSLLEEMICEKPLGLQSGITLSSDDIDSVQSDVAGMHILMHPYWVSDTVFDSLTPGQVKEGAIYQRIHSVSSTARFVWDKFFSKFEYAARSKLQQPTATSAQGSDEHQETVDLNTFDYVAVKYSMSFFKDESGFYVHETDFDREDIVNIARKTNKNVIVSCSDSRLSTRIKTKDESVLYAPPGYPKIEETTVLIHTFSDFSKLNLPSSELVHTVFGYNVEKIYQLHGENLNAHNNLSEPYRNGPAFAGIDYVYRDFKTGVIWALQAGRHIYFTFDLRNQNKGLVKILFKELADRYDGALSYDEMYERDLEYFESMADNNKNDFISLAIVSAKVLMEGLRQKFLESKETYLEHLNSAMEAAKTMQRLEDSITSIDEKKLEDNEREKCNKMYDDVMLIEKISAIKVIDRCVHVYTKNIYVQHDKTFKWYDVGTFHISINMYDNTYNTNGTVKIFNTKHQVHAFSEKMQAPHVFEDGHMCHGNIVGEMVDAYRRRDLYQMVLIVLSFLESANLDDAAGQYLTKWPEVTEETAKKIEIKDAFAFEEKSEEEEKFDEALSIPVHV